MFNRETLVVLQGLAEAMLFESLQLIANIITLTWLPVTYSDYVKNRCLYLLNS